MGRDFGDIGDGSALLAEIPVGEEKGDVQLCNAGGHVPIVGKKAPAPAAAGTSGDGASGETHRAAGAERR